MQTIARMDPDAVEKYYGTYQLGSEPATWLGRGLAPLGLVCGDVVDHRTLSAMLAGGRMTAAVIAQAHSNDETLDLDHLPRRPVSGQPRAHRAGFDLCFSAPKSVSVLATGLFDHAARDVVRAAHDASVQAAFSFFEAEAGRVRLARTPVPAG
ncbi:MAG: relaxase domain-containing protein, partial [Acidimicrobiales bacterium]